MRSLGAAFVLVLVLGGVARFVGLGDKPIWHDEVYTRIFAAGHHSEEWIQALYVGRPLARDEVLRFQRLGPDRTALDTVRGLARDEPQHPPAYYLLARLWMEVFGDALGTLRALSAIVSLASVLLAWWLARECMRWARAAPPTAPETAPATTVGATFVALVAASPFLVTYAQEAREYALWGASVLASTALLLRAERTGRWGAWLGFALVTALGLYTAFAHASVAACQGAWLAGRRIRSRAGWRDWVRAGAALGLAGALFLPWALLLLDHMDAFRASMDWSRAIVVPTGETLATLATNVSRPFVELGAAEDPSPFAAAMIALAVALVLWSLVRWIRRGTHGLRALFVLLLVVPVGLLVVPDLLVGGIRSASARYMFPAWLAALWLVAWSLASLGGRRGLALRVAVVAVAAASTLGVVSAAVPWSRELSIGLGAVANAINQTERPLVLGDRERHHPGNLLALATLVKPETEFVFLDHPARDAWIARLETEGTQGATPWPPGGLAGGLAGGRTLFVYAPVPQLLRALERAFDRSATPVWEGLHVACWRF